MCGIAGAIGAVDQEVTAAVEAMQAALHHRGPDAGGIWRGSGVVLAHRRLSIVDLSEGGAQPMLDAESGHVLTYNGEIYNFQALAHSLQAAGLQQTSDSDTEVLLQLCVNDGVEKALPKLDGMFAFAFWDSRAQTLSLVRDRLGIKPLYYTSIRRARGEVVLFASEVRALLATGLVERRLDPEGLRTYLWNGFVVDPLTAIAGVHALAPGHRLTLSANDLMHASTLPKPEPWWSLPPSVVKPGARATLGSALQSAVSRRLVADVPLGVFLSGGVDSSAIAALASRERSGIKTFCVAFPEERGAGAQGGGLDESAYAQAVASALGTEHTTLPLEEADFMAGLPSALDALDQPTFDAINTWFVSRAVKDAGLTVALAGTGGDEVFGGYTSFRDLPLAERLASALSAAPLPLLRRLAYLATRLKTGSPGEVRPQTRFGKLADVLATRGERRALYQVSYSLFTQDFLVELQGHDDERWGLSEDLWRSLAPVKSAPSLHAITNLELSLFLGNRLLRDTDATSMASSLEVRVPLLSHEVIEASAAVYPERRCLPVQKKEMLKTLTLPADVLALVDREKAGFEMPLARWCRRGLREEMAATFADADALRAVGLRPDAAARLWRSFLAEAPGIYWSRVWALFTLVRWCKTHGVSV